MKEHQSPKPVEDQDAPEQERMITPQEEAGQSVQEQGDPPQAEGRADRPPRDGRGRA